MIPLQGRTKASAPLLELGPLASKIGQEAIRRDANDCPRLRREARVGNVPQTLKLRGTARRRNYSASCNYI
jgi:hypothetical protein